MIKEDRGRVHPSIEHCRQRCPYAINIANEAILGLDRHHNHTPNHRFDVLLEILTLTQLQ